MNYGDFQALFTNWLNRSDLDQPTMQTIIERAMARVNREVRIAGMERDYQPSPDCPDGTWSTIPVPEDFIALEYFVADGKMIDPYTPGQLLRIPDSAGDPRGFSRFGGYWRLRPRAMHSVEIIYYGQFDPVVNPGDTNTLLSAAPEILLWASLSYAGDFFKMVEETPIWEQRYKDEVANLQQQSQDADFFASPQAVAAAHQGTHGLIYPDW